VSEKISVSVVIPAYNEEAGIAGVVEDIRRVMEGERAGALEDFEVLVVDDGSADKTAALAEKAGARVIRHAVNIGYGKALLTGFEQAQFDWVLMIDGDGSYSPGDIPKLLAQYPGIDMVVGARQGSFFWGSPFRAFLRRVYLSLAGFVAGLKIPDANSGLRLIRKEVLIRNTPVLCLGYSFSTTMTLSFIQGGRFVRFIPIEYLARKGKSKVSMLRDMLRTLQLMVQVVLYYNPLKFAVVLAFLPLLMAAGYTVRFGCGGRPVDVAMAGVCVLAALLVFLFGCLLDALRLHSRKDA